MSHARYIVADVFDGLASLETGSVDLVMTSPPFLALRSYLPADHPDKGREVGSEATPGEFIDALLDVVEACDRVLAPHGSLVFELGDTYAGSGGAGGDYNEGGLREGQPRFRAGYDRRDGRATMQAEDYGARLTTSRRRDKTDVLRQNAGGYGWPLDKSKVLIPQLFAISLAYGFNPLTGRTTEPWRVRNTVAWCRPNPPVGRDGDKFRPATSFLTVACKARDRYWDGDAVRTATKDPEKPRGGAKGAVNVNPSHGWSENRTEAHNNPAGAPLLDWWSIPTQPYAGSHYATYPSALVVPIVKSMCPLRVCRDCGQPSRRITEITQPIEADDSTRTKGSGHIGGYEHAPEIGWQRDHNTLGWSDCGHNNWRTGVVLDPFAGSGTTLEVATGHGLDAIGVDLDERNAELARERVGMFLSVEYPERVA